MAEKIRTELNQILNYLFPKRQPPAFSYYANNEMLLHQHFVVPRENAFLEGSPYFYNLRHHLVHFTSLEALNSIISERIIRLYNISHLKDPREYTYAGNLLTLTSEEIELSKRSIFVLSFCDAAAVLVGKTKRSEFNMWRLYSNYGNGVAIQFSVLNNPQRWKDYYLSEVHYGVKKKSTLKELSLILRKLKKLNPSYNIDLSQLLAFHKSSLYDVENEVRLMYDFRDSGLSATNYEYKNQKSPVIVDVPESTNCKYLELPIWSTGFEAIDEAIPLLKIEKIILGYQFKEKFNDEEIRLQRRLSENLGYTPNVELTRIARDYWEK